MGQNHLPFLTFFGFSDFCDLQSSRFLFSPLWEQAERSRSSSDRIIRSLEVVCLLWANQDTPGKVFFPFFSFFLFLII
jgi:hypothetical protein